MLAITASALLLPHQSIAQVSKPSDDRADNPTIADIETALATVESNTEIDATVKGTLRTTYKKAIAALKDAATDSERAAAYRESMTRAPVTSSELLKQLKDLPAADTSVPQYSDFEDLKQKLDEKRGVLAGLQEQLLSVTKELTDGEQRPADIIARIPKAQAELSELEAELSELRERLGSEEFSNNNVSTGRVADRILLQAQEEKLLSELEMLNQEQKSMSVRRNLLQTQKDLLSKQVENASAVVTAYETSLDKSVTKQTQKIISRAEELRSEFSVGHPATSLVTEVKKLADDLIETLRDKTAITAATDNSTAKLGRLTQQQEGIQKQLELGQTDREMAEVLLKLRDLLQGWDRDLRQNQSWPNLSQTRLAAVLVDSDIERQKEVQARFADQSSDAVNELIAMRIDVLRKLRRQYQELLPDLAKLEFEEMLYSEKVNEIQEYISEQLFWMKISPPINLKTFIDSPKGLLWIVSPKHGQEFAQSVLAAFGENPYSSIVVVLIFLLLVILRPWMLVALKGSGEGVGRVSVDRFALTGKALLLTLLLASPIPLLFGYVAMTFPELETALDWREGLRVGMQLFASSIFVAFFVVTCCIPDGLGQKHFGWPKEALPRFRKTAISFLVVYFPLMILTCCTLFSEAAEFINGIGRVSFILAHVLTTVSLIRIFYWRKEAQLVNGEKNRPRLFSRLLALLLISCPLFLVGLAAAGYMIAAARLSYVFVLSLSMITSAAILYACTLRWFKIEHRKLALSEALERRRIRQESAVSEDHEQESTEEISVDDRDQELDIDTVDDQMRHLMRLLFGLGAAIAVLSLWSERLPLLEYFESVKLPLMTGLTLLDLKKATVILVVGWIAIKNLPGLLEFAIFRSKSIHAGTRNAITTIGQYTLVAIGLFMLFSVLKLDWAQFGWIAGGLSVGIGFGMQEIVANFICGLILLIERPVRVGDVVTIEGEIGTVTKIHLRATTITNFDRGEVVLPNKTLITSKLVNWTLSSSLNRVTIPIGVAYGTDTDTAKRIMLEVAAEHPNVSADPAPMTIFNEFADSSLNILLRAFLPDRSSRDATINDLNTEINKRFAAAGIEIPFPQRDFHLRSGWDTPNREPDRTGEPTQVFQERYDQES